MFSHSPRHRIKKSRAGCCGVRSVFAPAAVACIVKNGQISPMTLVEMDVFGGCCCPVAQLSPQRDVLFEGIWLGEVHNWFGAQKVAAGKTWLCVVECKETNIEVGSIMPRISFLSNN